MKPLLAGTLIAFAMGAFSGRLPVRKQESGAAVKRVGILDSETAVLFDRETRPVFGKQESGRR